MANCQVCGKPSGYFPLCKDCSTQKESGFIVKCETCGKWHKKAEPCNCEVKTPVSPAKTASQAPCVVCGQPSPYGPLCTKCFTEKNQYKADLPKYEQINDAKEHYLNLKNTAYVNINKYEYTQVAALRLFAIAEKIKEQFSKSEYFEKAPEDISNLLTKKREFIEKTKNKVVSSPSTKPENATGHEELDPDEKDYRKAFPADHRCNDGHYVRSKAEKIIDDYLEFKRIRHVTETKLYDPETKEVFYTDWFLPDIADGIYIEHFGLSTDAYKAKCERKIAFYKRQNFRLIVTHEPNIQNIGDFLDTKLADIQYEHSHPSKK